MKKRQFSKERVVVALLLLWILLVLFINMGEKVGFHIDEIYSYGLSNSHFHPFPWEFDTWLSGDYYQNYLTTNSGTSFDYGSVYYNQTQDVHPPLYYFILHTVSSFLPGVFSKWIGLSINLIIHGFVFYVIYRIIDYLIDNKWVSLLGATFWILSKGAIDSLLFIRMYPLLTLIQVVLLYLTLLFYEKEANKKILFLVFLTVSLGALTHYYFYIYAFLLTLVVCGFFLFQKEMKKMFLYGLSALGGVLSAVAVFPAVFTHVLESNRGIEVLEGFESDLTTGGNVFFEFIQIDIFRNIPVVLLIILGIALLSALGYRLYKAQVVLNEDKQKIYYNLKVLGIIVLPVLIYTFTVQQVSHYQTARYIFAIYPMIVIALFLAIYKILTIVLKDKVQINLVISLSSAVIILFGLATQENDYKFEETIAMNEVVANIEDQNILVVMDSYWKITNYVPDLSGFNQIYPIEIKDNLQENLPSDESFNQSDQLIVLINANENFEDEKVEEALFVQYDYENITTLIKSEDYTLYELSKSIE